MEKMIIIDGKEINLKVTAACTRLYKMQYRRDLMRDVYKLKTLDNFIKDGEVVAPDELIANVDFEMFLDLLWTFAKKADPSIPSPLEWEDQFTVIPFRDILPVVMELLTVLLDGQKKSLAK